MEREVGGGIWMGNTCKPMAVSFQWMRKSTTIKKKKKNKITSSGPITSWQIDGETMETVTDFIFWGSKITANGDCSLEIKILAPWKKSYDQPRQHIKKQRLLCQQGSV